MSIANDGDVMELERVLAKVIDPVNALVSQAIAIRDQHRVQLDACHKRLTILERENAAKTMEIASLKNDLALAGRKPSRVSATDVTAEGEPVVNK